jgi:hypothetical protein
MANTQMACKCGAVYEVIETKGPSFRDDSFKCVLCGTELVSWSGSNVGQFRLIRRPETDRD